METKKRGKFMRTKEKLSGLLLAVCMAFIMAPITARADVTTEKWTDFAAADFAGGSGTKEEPYQIATAEQLAKLAADVNSGVPGQIHSGEYFKLTAPIDLSGKRWIPIGYGNASSKSFSGYFDGNNQVITGLYVDERGNNVCAGLFGVVVAISDETVLKNISIENAEIYAGYGTDANASPDIYGAGVLVGDLTTMGGSGATFIGVENCHGTGQVDSKMYAGGLIGSASRAHVSNCSADVVIAKSAEHTTDSTGWHSDADNHWNTCECGEKLNLSGHSFTWVIDKEASAEEKGSKHEQCTVCGYAKAAVEIPAGGTETSYEITEGTGSSYALQSGNSLTVRGNGEFSKFTGIKVDGVQIGTENYEAESGSTVVTLKSSYLDTLTAGTHSLEILWTDGSASTAFTIQTSESQKPDNEDEESDANQNPQPASQNNTEQTASEKNQVPKTGDDSNFMVWIAGLAVSGVGFAGVTYYRKKKHL